MLPGIHVAMSALSGYYYGRHMFVLARQQSLPQPLPQPPFAQLVFWLFNMPCLLVVTLLSNTLPQSWQPQELTRFWATQPVTLFFCAVVNTGVWIWLGAQWEDAGERVSWWRWGLCAAGVGLAAGILLNIRKLDPQAIPFIAWPVLLAVWAARPALAGAGRPDKPASWLRGGPE